MDPWISSVQLTPNNLFPLNKTFTKFTTMISRDFVFFSRILLLGSFVQASDFKSDAVASPLWNTPLCSNVKKYWWCIMNKDDMNGLRHPSQYSLSWFLGWPRSSVCNYGSQNAVGAESSKYVAMASVRYLCATCLDPFICLYLFARDSLYEYPIPASKQLSMGEVC